MDNLRDGWELAVSRGGHVSGSESAGRLEFLGADFGFSPSISRQFQLRVVIGFVIALAPASEASQMTNFGRLGFGLTLAVLLVGASDANAALITFDNRTAFDLAAPGLPIEDFEEANVAAGGIVAFTGPLNASTDNAVFSPGDILPGFTMQSVPGSTLVALGDGVAGFPTVNVGPNLFGDNTNLLFSNASAVGFDLHANVTSDMTISMFGVGDVLLGSFIINVPSGTAGTFFGVIDDTSLITRINVTAANSGGEVFDNVAFGAAAIPEPSTFLLIGGGLFAVVARRRLQKRS